MPSRRATLAGLLVGLCVGPAWACEGLPGDVAEGLLIHTNRVRAQAGLGPLRAEPELAAVADRYACALARTGRLAHRGVDGSTPTDRVRQAGHPGCGVRENIAQGPRTAGQTWVGWMASPGHRANILAPHARSVGFGAATGMAGRGGPRWVMVLAEGCGGPS